MSLYNTRLEIATDIESISNVEDQRTLVNNAVNLALQRVYEFHDWPFYLQEGAIETKDDYSTGTVAITQGDKTATVTTGVVSNSWVGRKVRFSGSKPYYKIASVSTGANTFTLEQNYQETTLTAGTYIIYKDEYRLASDVDKYKIMRQLQNGIPLLSTAPSDFDEIHVMPQSYADPTMEIMIGSKLDTYTTGTLSGSGTTLTGTGTDWTSVEGLGRLSLIRIGSTLYTVKSVDSATQLTIYENCGTVAASTSYTLTLDNLVVQLYQIPNAQRLLYYRYYRIPTPMVNDYDIPDMPRGWRWLLLYGALSIVLTHKGDVQKQQFEAERIFIEGLNSMKLKIGSYTVDRIYKRKSTDRIKRKNDALEASNFDRRYSAP